MKFDLTQFFRQFFWLAVILIVSILPTVPSYYFGEPVMYQCHDYIIHPARLALIESAFRQGTLIPNWLTEFSFGFGSPAMLFSWFLPYYPALLFRLSGVSIVDSIKLVFLLSTIVSGIGIYLLGRRVTNKTAALVAVTFFLIAPFRLNLIFTRCSFGETFAQMFIPFVFIFLLSKHRTATFLMAITLALLVISHFLTFMFTAFLLILWFVLVGKNRGKIILAMLGGLLLSAFYWIPSFLEQGMTYYADVSKMWYADQFVSLKAVFSSPWQYGPPVPNDQALSMSFQIGKIHWLVVLLTPLLWFRRQKLTSLQFRVAIFLIASFVVSILLQLRISKPLWDNFNFAQIITFPWRLQTITTFSVALLAALMVSVLPLKKFVVGILVILLLLANRNHFVASRGNYAGDAYLQQFDFNGGSYIEYMPNGSDLAQYNRFFKDQPHDIPLILNAAGLELISSEVKPTKIFLKTRSGREVSAIIRQYSFAGWQGRIDNKIVPLKSSQGLINLDIPAGQHEVLLSFEQTPVRKLALLVSLTFTVIFFLFGLWKLSSTAKCTARRKPTGGT